ncbi:unnamed protein product [Lampetra planeri]
MRSSSIAVGHRSATVSGAAGRSQSWASAPGPGHRGAGQAVLAVSETSQVVQDEKEELQVLNSRFAGYIDKVRLLGERNSELKAELAKLRHKSAGPSSLWAEFAAPFGEVKERIARCAHVKGAADIAKGNLQEDLDYWASRLEQERALRDQALGTLKEFRKDVDDATLQKVDLERQAEQLTAEIEFLKKLHDEEVAELLVQIQEANVSVELEANRPDLAAALRDIRAQYESVATQNVADAAGWYKNKFDALQQQAAKRDEQMRATKEEISEFRRQAQSLQGEIDALRSRGEALEAQLREMGAEHAARLAEMRDAAALLEAQLRGLKADMAQHLRAYQELLNIKLQLDAELATYRHLLDAEEKRLKGGVA